jgi:hypothetical protein
MSKTLIGRQMLTGMFCPTAGGELVPDGGRCPVGPSIFFSGVDPEPRGFGLSFSIALLEQLNRSIIHEDGLRLKHMVVDRVR